MDIRPQEASTPRAKRPRGTGCIYRQRYSRFWWIQYYRNGVPYRESTHSTDSRKARQFMQQRLSEIAGGNFCGPAAERIKVAELADDLLRDYRINGRRSLDLTGKRWEKHLKPFFGALRAVQVTTDFINRYIEGRLKEGAQNATINRELAALRRMFNLAYRSTPRKVHQVPTFPHLKENAPRSGFVDDAQYLLLCCNCKEPWLRALLAVAYSFGFRKAELLNMRLRQVDLLNHTITLDPGTTKNEQGRVVKMTPSAEVYRLLCGCVRGKQPDSYVFTRPGGTPIRDFRDAWRKLCNAAGLAGLLFHDLRRSAVRNMIRSGVPERVAMMISGHKTRTVFDRYNIVSEADLADAARKIEQGRTSVAQSPVTTREFRHSDRHSESDEPLPGEQHRLV
jgi:integrase